MARGISGRTMGELKKKRSKAKEEREKQPWKDSA
jgi:hypothetical protein